jgi:hypothetical protein
MPLLVTMGAPVVRAEDDTIINEVYESLTTQSGNDPKVDDVIAKWPYYLSKTLQETVIIMNDLLKKDLMQFKEEVKDTFRHTDSQVYMHTDSHLEQVCRETQDQWNVSLKAIILAYENISHIIIHKGVFVDYSLVSMLFGGLRRDSTAKVVIKLD